MPSVEQTLPTGAALRRLRVETGRSVKEVSEALGWSSSKLSRIETSLSRVKPEDLLARTRMQRRMLRQAVLGRIPPPRIDVVLDETVLRRPIGDPAIMRRQMIRLQELSDRPEISVRIIPLRAGAHPALTGPFAILDFPEALRIPSHVWLDDLAGGV